MSGVFTNKTLISDIPEDYLNLYANAYATYSDRVHACIATLAFGNYARLYSQTPRAYLFERLGLGTIKRNILRLDEDKIKLEKSHHISFLKEIIRL